MKTTTRTPLSESPTRVLLLGSGELGREVAIEASRLGVEVVACDRYANAPAMHVAHRSEVFDMQDPAALRAAVERWRPDAIIPEIEAVATSTLVALEAEGWRVIPTARATHLTMDREGIRQLAAESLGIPTSRYRFASDLRAFRAAVAEVGLPCVVKPVMSSSGKGQSTLRESAAVDDAWREALSGSRGASARVIVEGFVAFDYEITLLTVRTRDGSTHFCPPIGHQQEQGDYVESWQPHPMSDIAWKRACEIAATVTEALGGCGVFGVELFVQGDEVIFSEVSPRPHDTGMVTMASQPINQFELHVRAILGLPIPSVRMHGPAASAVIRAAASIAAPAYAGLDDAYAHDGVSARIFGKPTAHAGRRMGVVLARAADVAAARALARRAAALVRVYDPESA